MKTAKIVIGLFLIIAAFMGIPTGGGVSDLEGGTLFGFISMAGVGLLLFIWGIASNPKKEDEKQ